MNTKLQNNLHRGNTVSVAGDIQVQWSKEWIFPSTVLVKLAIHTIKEGYIKKES